MNTIYKMTSGMFFDENERRAVPVYGIDCVVDGKTTKRLRDISIEKDFVEYLTNRLNICQASYIHFTDIVENSIAI